MTRNRARCSCSRGFWLGHRRRIGQLVTEAETPSGLTCDLRDLRFANSGGLAALRRLGSFAATLANCSQFLALVIGDCDDDGHGAEGT